MDVQRPDDLLARRGIRAAAVLAFAWMVLWAGSTPAFWGVDTTSHVAYAVEAASGRWPTIHTPNPRPDLPGLEERLSYDVAVGRANRLDVWTSNHPPLYFVTVGLPLRLGLAVDRGDAALLVARLLTAVGAAAGVLAVGWLARMLVPARPRVTVLAAAGAALSPVLVHYGGLVYNDTLAWTLSTVGLAAGLAALRHGPTRRLVAIGAVAAGAGALTRSSSLAVAAVTILAFAAAGWRHGVRWAAPAGMAERGPRAVVAVGLVVGAGVAAIAGPAILVNLARYGSVTAAADLFTKFDRSPGPDPRSLLLSPRFYRDQIDRFASELAIGTWWPSTTTRIVGLLVLASTVGLVLSAVRRRWPRAGWAPVGWAPVGWVCALAPIALMLVASAIFISEGGSAHSRYLLPGLGGLAVLWAVGIDSLPGGRSSAAAVICVGLLMAANMALYGDFLEHHQAWYAKVTPAAQLPMLAAQPIPVLVALTVGLPALGGVIRALLAVGVVTAERSQSSSVLNRA